MMLSSDVKFIRFFVGLNAMVLLLDIVAGQPDGASHTTHGMSARAPLTVHKILLFPEHKREVGLLNIFWNVD